MSNLKFFLQLDLLGKANFHTVTVATNFKLYTAELARQSKISTQIV